LKRPCASFVDQNASPNKSCTACLPQDGSFFMCHHIIKPDVTLRSARENESKAGYMIEENGPGKQQCDYKLISTH